MDFENKPKMITFGPVPSRRLGHSLGINNIPPKNCSYSCVYCQLGNTLDMLVERKAFYKPEEILRKVKIRIKEAKEKSEPIDYLTFVPDGEPTLDINIGDTIEILKPLGIKIAVISNASLIWDESVRNDLYGADLISLKIDTVSESIWHRVDRPYKTLRLNSILQGISEFSDNFNGSLITETMFIKGMNDSTKDIRSVADYIAGLMPAKSYISIPTRPPAEKWVNPTTESIINTAYQIFNDKLLKTEYLIGYEGNAFAFTGNVEEDLLSITSVHPMREEAVKEFLNKAKTNWEVIEKLISENQLTELNYRRKKFYLRKLIKRF